MSEFKEINPQFDIDRSKAVYSRFRNAQDNALRIGIFEEDLEKAAIHPETLFVDYDDNGVRIPVPALVPIDILKFYNGPLMRRLYGNDTKIYCYVHPPTSGYGSEQEIQDVIEEVLEHGGVVVTELYNEDRTSPMAKFVDQIKYLQKYHLEAFGDKTDSRVDYFAGHVILNQGLGVFKAPTISDIYKRLIDTGEIIEDRINGPSLADTITGEEAEAIWEMYEKPFEGLGWDDPTVAGFEKDELIQILADPSISKIINRVDGKITTLMLFLQDFEKAPWFNKYRYAKDYKEYFDTNNILMFPGIVSDENKRGNNFGMEIVEFVTKLVAKRASNLLITFECTEVSTIYVPKIVKAAIEHSGLAHVEGLDNPIGKIVYFGISKH